MKHRSAVTWLKLPFYYGKLILLIAQCKALLLLETLRRRARGNWIVTRPDLPSPYTAFYKIAHRLGYRLTNDARHAGDLVIAWEDATIRREDRALETLAAEQRVLNRDCKDISKRQVAKVFADVFGYSLEVDPQSHAGPMVRKSDTNAPHDGAIVLGPIGGDRTGQVYQKVVNNITGPDVQDIRLPVFGEFLPFCLLKRMPLEHRFTNEKGTAAIREVSELLSNEEQALILRFCRAIGLDFGELDVLRDVDDGRIYIVDVNNTPYGPLDRGVQVRWYFDALAWDALNRMSAAFLQAFDR